MPKLVTIAVPAALAAGALVFAMSGPPAPDQVGYFKSPDGNRVLAYVARADMTPEEARARLARVPHTEGQLTRAVIYTSPGRDPGHRLTSAPDYLTAATMLDEPPFSRWDWSVMIDARGRPDFEGR